MPKVLYFIKVEKILKCSLHLIPSPSVKIQIIGGKVFLRCKSKTLLGVVNKLLKTKSLLTKPSNVLPLHHKQTFLPIIWIFTEGDGIKSRLPFKIFSILLNQGLLYSRPLLRPSGHYSLHRPPGPCEPFIILGFFWTSRTIRNSVYTILAYDIKEGKLFIIKKKTKTTGKCG